MDDGVLRCEYGNMGATALDGRGLPAKQGA
jgi:hypothetical protein